MNMIVMITSVKLLTRLAMNDQTGLVYIVRHGATRLYKIGKTSVGSMKRRLQNLQVGNPIGLTIIGNLTHNNALMLEAKIHNLLATHRVRGEWFDCSLEEIYRAVGKAAMSVPDYDARKCIEQLSQCNDDAIRDQRRRGEGIPAAEPAVGRAATGAIVRGRDQLVRVGGGFNGLVGELIVRGGGGRGKEDNEQRPDEVCSVALSSSHSTLAKAETETKKKGRPSDTRRAMG